MPQNLNTPERVRPCLLEWINEDPNRRVIFSARRASEALDIPYDRVFDVLVLLEREGEAGRRMEDLKDGTSRLTGWGMTRVVTPRRSLADLLDAAAAAVDPTLSLAVGRHRQDDFSPVSALTRSQLKDVRGVAMLIARHALGGSAGLVGVDDKFLLRTTAATGVAEWTLLHDVASWADSRARERGASSGHDTSKASNANRAKLVASARLLIRFAIGLGWTVEGVVTPGVLPVELDALARHWIAKLRRRQDGRNVKTLGMGVRLLMSYMARDGHLDVRSADWPRIATAIETDAKDGTLRERQLTAAKLVWRHIHLLGAHFPMTWQRPERLNFLHNIAITSTCASVSTADGPADLVFAHWTDVDGRALDALVEGPTGVRRMFWWMTADDVRLALDDTFPPRVYEPEYEAVYHREKLRAATAVTKLTHVGTLAGWAAQNDGFDIHQLDAFARLLAPDRAKRYAAWHIARAKRGTASDDPDAGYIVAVAMLRTVRRFLRDLAMFAHHVGKDAASAQWTKDADSLSHLILKLHTEVDSLENVIARDEAWTNRGAPGLVKVDFLRMRLVDQAVRAAGLDVKAQLELLRTYRRMPERSAAERQAKHRFLDAMRWRTAHWATLLRRAMLAQFGRKVPLRDMALRALRPSMVTGIGRTGLSAPIWEPGSAVLVTVPGEFCKNGDPYRVAYVAEESAGDVSAEADAARDLLELYASPGGALDRLRSQAGPDVDTDFFFVPDSTKGTTGNGTRAPRQSLQFARNGLSADWAAALRDHGAALNIDLERLATIPGGFGIHSIRGLFGRHWGHRHQMINYVADMLHHGNIEITKKNYIGVDATSISPNIRALDAAFYAHLVD